MNALGARWRWLGLLLGLICLALVAWQFSEALHQVPEEARRIGFGPLVASTVLFGLGGFCLFLAYANLARAMGMRDLPFSLLGHVYFGQLLKYLPGRVWGFAFQAARASDLAPPVQWTALLSVHFVAAVAALVAIAVGIEAVTGSGSWILAGFSLASALAATAPIAFEWRTLRPRLPLFQAVTISALLHLAAFLQALALVPVVTALLQGEASLGGLREGGHYLLAWLAGYAAIIAPAGLGVREGAFVALAEGLTPAALLTVAAAARVTMMMADVLLGLAFLRYPGGRGASRAESP